MPKRASYGFAVSRKARNSCAMLIFLLVLVSPVGQAQPPPLIQTDGVYLLDVTSSMVGLEPGAGDILQEVIDLLLIDIDRFPGGKFILIMFANGPYDLDGSGPIQAVYEIDIQTEQDRLFLKRFLRPSVYGPFPPAPGWPGVYDLVKRTISIGPTGVYTSILAGLDILERLQSEGGSEYAARHTQELVVYSDGRNNAPGSPTFEAVLKRLQERHFQMLGHFRYKRYLFSRDPKDLENAQDECRLSQRLGMAEYVQNVVAPDITQLVVLTLDRRVLGFPNIWAASVPEDARTVTLHNIRVYYDLTKAKLLEGRRIRVRPVQPEDFALPPDVSLRVTTEPAELRFPLEQFDLKITFEPFSRLKAALKDRQGLQGYVRFELVRGAGDQQAAEEACPRGTSREPLIDFKQATILADLPYVLPALQATWAAEGEGFALTLSPNDVFKSLSAEEQTVRVEYPPKRFSLMDDQGRGHSSGEPFSLQGIRTLRLKIPEGLTPGPYSNSVKLRPELPDVFVNGQEFFETRYEFTIISFDRTRVVCPNLWSEDVSGDARRVTCELTLYGGPAAWGQLKLQIVDSPLAESGIVLDLEPKLLKPPFAQRPLPLQITVAPYSRLAEDADLQSQLNRARADGFLLFEFEDDPEHPVYLRPSRLPIDLVYFRPEIALSVNGQEPPSVPLNLGTLYRDQAALTLEFAVNETFRQLPDSRQRIRVEYDSTHFYLTDAGSQKIALNEINPLGTQTLVLRVNPSLVGDRTYEGMVSVSSDVEGLRIAGRDGSLAIRYQLVRPAAQVMISDGRSDRNLGRVRRGMTVAAFQLQYDETYAKEPKPIQIEYDEVFFRVVDSRGNVIRSGSALGLGETSLALKMNPQLPLGALSRALSAELRFFSEEGVKINAKPNDGFRYEFHVSGWLATLLWIVGGIGLAILVLGGGSYCVFQRKWPREAYEELSGQYGPQKIAALLALLVALWLGGFLAGMILS